MYRSNSSSNPIDTSYVSNNYNVTAGSVQASSGVSVTLPNGQTATANYQALNFYPYGINTYLNLYFYVTNPLTSPTYANTVDTNSDHKVYVFVRSANTTAPTQGYAEFYIKSPILNPTSDEIVNTIKSNYNSGFQVIGKHSTAVAGSSVTIPSGGVVKLDMTNLIRQNSIGPIAILNTASGALNSSSLKDSRVIIYYRDSNDALYVLTFQTIRDDTAGAWYIWGYNPYPSAITINIDDITSNNMSMYFTYNRW